jgi:very-short-patch-repair endonuclease
MGKPIDTARGLYKKLGYDRWENFNNLVKRAANLICNGVERGVITKIKFPANIGGGATRYLTDYEFDANALDLIKRLANGFKINNCFSTTNETTLLQLLKKYCDYRGIKFTFQYQLGPFIYDCLIGDSLFIEFDEPHHNKKRQSVLDRQKTVYAEGFHYRIIRFDLNQDIVDMIIAIEKELSILIHERLDDDKSFGRIRSKGDQALFGGISTAEMKKRLRVHESRPLADFLPTITIKAKDFATEITNFKVNKENLRTEMAVSGEHVKNNTDVRQLLADRGIVPEELPAAEDIRKIERRMKAEEKRITPPTSLGRLPVSRDLD